MTVTPHAPDLRIGTGNWHAFPATLVDHALECAAQWKSELADVEWPWLCWCVDDDWCMLQQELVASAGWTPIVGTDGSVEQPTILPGSRFINFNAEFKFTQMWMHFPLEFVFAFTRRMAFWHSDLLPPLSIMKQLAKEFETIQPGEYIGVRGIPSLSLRLKRLRRALASRSLWLLRNVNARRWFELVGCTTAEASRGQFENGCGLWRRIDCHPNSRLDPKSPPHYDHGVGIWYWEKRFAGKTREVPINVHPYHYVAKGKQRGRTKSRIATKGDDLKSCWDLNKIREGLEL